METNLITTTTPYCHAQSRILDNGEAQQAWTQQQKGIVNFVNCHFLIKKIIAQEDAGC